MEGNNSGVKEIEKDKNQTEIQEKDVTCDVPKKQVFIPGGIHEPDAIQFWRSVLKANQWVMNVLENGYVIPLVEAPKEYYEDNNMSAKRQMDFVRQSVKELKLKIQVFTYYVLN